MRYEEIRRNTTKYNEIRRNTKKYEEILKFDPLELSLPKIVSEFVVAAFSDCSSFARWSAFAFKISSSNFAGLIKLGPSLVGVKWERASSDFLQRMCINRESQDHTALAILLSLVRTLI